MKSKLSSHIVLCFVLGLGLACSSKTEMKAAPEQKEPEQQASAESSASAEQAPARSSSPVNAKVSILEPTNGATVPTTFTVKFGIENMSVAPAGTQQENSGHHHLLVDTDPLPDLNQPLPATEHIIHFGKGQTETTLTLPAGQHSLQLILGDANHIPHQPPVISEKITVTVQ